MHARFSILIPTYNRERLIGPTVDSILSQTFRDFEVIVIDDGSTDRTPEVLQSYGDRIKFLRQSNQGPEAARRLGASVATGEYFVLLDSDDLLLPWALATYDRVVREFDAPALIIGLLQHFQDEEGYHPEASGPDEFQALKFRDYLAKDVPVSLSSSNIVVRKSVFEQAGAPRSTFTTFPMDTFNYVLLFGTFGPCVIVRAPHTVAYREHAGNAIRDVAGMLKGIHLLAAAERRGLYPGGRLRRFARYACIGGVTWCWVARALKHQLVGLAAVTVAKTHPMLLAGVSSKALRLLHHLRFLVFLAFLNGSKVWAADAPVSRLTDQIQEDGFFNFLGDAFPACLDSLPEPWTVALVGLGAAAQLLYCRQQRETRWA